MGEEYGGGAVLLMLALEQCCNCYTLLTTHSTNTTSSEINSHAHRITITPINVPVTMWTVLWIRNFVSDPELETLNQELDFNLNFYHEKNGNLLILKGYKKHYNILIS
jgi:hypothetical protein